MATRMGRKTGLLIAVGVLALVLAVLMAVLMLLRAQREAPSQEPATLPPTTAAPTTVPTEPTLPPPEANPYHYTDFQYNGRYRTCLAVPTAVGIDVSRHQKTIDWQAVADSGVEFVIIRVGYRGYKTGLVQPDELAQSNYEGAKAAGLKVGAYFFSQAVTVEEALEEAEYLLAQVRDWEVDMPLVYDWEQKKEGRTLALDPRVVTDCALAFCGKIREAGYTPMVYFNPHHASRFFYLEELVDHPFWLAYYTDRMQYSYKVEMWQYTSSGKVPGITTPVDINLWFMEE